MLKYEDVDMYQSLLKKTVLELLPGLYCWLVMEKIQFDYLMPTNIYVIATIILGIRTLNTNSTSMQVIDIYNNGMVRPLNQLGVIIESKVCDWINKIETAQMRYKKRLSIFKRELIEKTESKYNLIL